MHSLPSIDMVVDGEETKIAEVENVCRNSST